jgi:hypothetical protein
LVDVGLCEVRGSCTGGDVVRIRVPEIGELANTAAAV